MSVRSTLEQRIAQRKRMSVFSGQSMGLVAKLRNFINEHRPGKIVPKPTSATSSYGTQTVSNTSVDTGAITLRNKKRFPKASIDRS